MGTAVMTDMLVRCALPQPSRAPAASSSLQGPSSRICAPSKSASACPSVAVTPAPRAAPSHWMPRGPQRSVLRRMDGPCRAPTCASGTIRPSRSRPVRLGPIWVKTPWYMEGYGYPPELEPIQERDGGDPLATSAAWMRQATSTSSDGRTTASRRAPAISSTWPRSPPRSPAHPCRRCRPKSWRSTAESAPVLGAILETAGSPSPDRDPRSRHPPLAAVVSPAC